MPEDKPHIRSEAVQDILTRVPHWMILWGNSILFILVILFFFLSWLIQYPDVITAEAVITSETPPQKELAQVSGRLDTILVSDNQTVKRHDVLAMIENTARLEDIMLLKQVLDTITVAKNNFQFPIEHMPILWLGDVSEAYAAFLQAYDDYRLNKNLDPYENRQLTNQFVIKELELRLDYLYDERRIDLEKLKLAEIEYTRDSLAAPLGLNNVGDFERSKLNFLNSKKALKTNDISLSQAYQQLNEARKNAKETQINSVGDNTKLTQGIFRAYQRLKEAITTWELRYLLQAEIDGSVSFLDYWTKNQYVNAGQLVFTVVPHEGEDYLARIKAPVLNAGKIKTGQKVNIRLLNYPDTEYGTLPGSVQSISKIPTEDGHYSVTVSLQKKLITSYNTQIPFKSELSGTAEIVTEDLRLLERLFYELRGLFKN